MSVLQLVEGSLQDVCPSNSVWLILRRCCSERQSCLHKHSDEAAVVACQVQERAVVSSSIEDALVHHPRVSQVLYFMYIQVALGWFGRQPGFLQSLDNLCEMRTVSLHVMENTTRSSSFRKPQQVCQQLIHEPLETSRAPTKPKGMTRNSYFPKEVMNAFLRTEDLATGTCQ